MQAQGAAIMELRRSVIPGRPVPALPSWLTEPLWGQFTALLPERPEYHPDHPLGCHRPRVSDRIVFDKLLQVLRFGCSYQAIADTTCSATTIRNRRDEWIALGVFARLKRIALESYDRIVGLVLDQIAVDGSITKAPGGGELAGRSPVDRGKQGLKRSGMTDGYGIPLGRVLAGANQLGDLASCGCQRGPDQAASRGEDSCPSRCPTEQGNRGGQGWRVIGGVDSSRDCL